MYWGLWVGENIFKPKEKSQKVMTGTESFCFKLRSVLHEFLTLSVLGWEAGGVTWHNNCGLQSLQYLCVFVIFCSCVVCSVWGSEASTNVSVGRLNSLSQWSCFVKHCWINIVFRRMISWLSYEKQIGKNLIFFLVFFPSVQALQRASQIIAEIRETHLWWRLSLPATLFIWVENPDDLKIC